MATSICTGSPSWAAAWFGA